jgi:hypothetical protein
VDNARLSHMLAAMRLRAPKVYTLYVTGGFVGGLLFGARVFPDIEGAFGYPTTDIILGLLGAIVVALMYEIVAQIRVIP